MIKVDEQLRCENVIFIPDDDFSITMVESALWILKQHDQPLIIWDKPEPLRLYVVPRSSSYAS